MNYLTEFKIQQLRTKNLTAAVETIAVTMGAVVANMLIPQLLLQYVYTDPSAFGLEAPAVFTYMPLVTYGIALAYFVYAMVGNIMRCKKANVLEQELMLTGGDCCSDGTCCNSDEEEISEDELKELERIVDEALKPAKKTTKKKIAKTAKKKTAKK